MVLRRSQWASAARWAQPRQPLRDFGARHLHGSLLCSAAAGIAQTAGPGDFVEVGLSASSVLLYAKLSCR